MGWGNNESSEDKINKIKEKIYNILQPGFTRLPINFRAQISLEKLLKQNTLQPTDGVLNAARKVTVGKGNTFFHGFNTGFQDIQNVHTKMYIDSDANPAGSNGFTNTRLRKGLISGVPVVDLEEPISRMSNGSIRQLSGSEVFTFKDDDDQYLRYTHRFRGFYSNIPGNVREEMKANNNFGTSISNADAGGKLLPSISQHNKQEVDVDSNAAADAQYFPFMFESVNRSTQVGVDATKSNVYEQFAFFQGTLSQLQENFVPNWSSKQFLGRTEEVHTYQYTGRTMDIRFIIFSNSIRELQNTYERVNWLAQQTYPMYDINVGGPSRMANGPIIRITIGDMFKRIPGFIRNLSYNWDHLGANKWELTKGGRMPQSCEVSLSFQVIHDYMPDRDTNFYSGVGQFMTGGRSATFQKALFTADKNLNKEVFKPESNLIPTTSNGNLFGGKNEDFVTLMARNSIRNADEDGRLYTAKELNDSIDDQNRIAREASVQPETSTVTQTEDLATA